MNIKINERDIRNLVCEVLCRVLREQYDKLSTERTKMAQRLSNDEIDGFPVCWWKEYVPQDQKTDREHVAIREFIYTFKNDDDARPKEKYKASIDMAFRYVSSKLNKGFVDCLQGLVLLCLPCSTQERYKRRYKQFSSRLCKELGLINGYEYVKYLKDAQIPSHWGRDAASKAVYEVDKDFFKGKEVVLFDDLFTTGQTIEKARELLERAGARPLMAICLAKTKKS